YSYEAPRSYVDTNVTGTLNILEAARAAGAARVLVVSTSEVYGTALTLPIGESHPLQAQSPYAASKIAAEKLAESYARSFGLPAVVVRPFNTYGPRQSLRAVIPTLLAQLLGGRRTLALGDASTTRDFNFVEDTVTGLIKLAACEAAIGRVVNIGTGTDVSIRQVAETAGALLGKPVKLRVQKERLRPRDSEVRRLCADNALLKTLTGWAPPARLREGLAKTATWIQERIDRYDPDRYYT
ncbi:MAG: GDP-mannose 4,6-dehydratase, partial [Lentisphaerae bacterium]|nr:GDP-mannose 4,6-dehydratase [Lentisphaerota bacterium]